LQSVTVMMLTQNGTGGVEMVIGVIFGAVTENETFGEAVTFA